MFTDLVPNTFAVPLLGGTAVLRCFDTCIFPKFSRDDNAKSTSFRYYNIQILVETALPAQIFLYSLCCESRVALKRGGSKHILVIRVCMSV